ncbi:baseplate assembly protein [Sporosarcina sp. FSL K6-1508]|uniref:baseplate assembly protein n=1 Tax=Sporosarcina sp. FSL K6-1508 TaxID=2921553 RepID=UPI0030F920CF
MKLSDLPDFDFVETNPELILNNIISDYENAYFESTGVKAKLYPGDPMRIFLYTQALREIQLRQIINDVGKQNFVKYARSDKLDHLGSGVKTFRGKPGYAKTRMKITASQSGQAARLIPSGQRFTPADGLFFSTEEDYVLNAGESEIIVPVVCEEFGDVGNDYSPGEINVMVEQLPFMISALNLDATQGGVDKEGDEPFRERVHLAPEGFSVAGPEGAYIYHAKSYSSLIIDVKPLSEEGSGVVDLYVLLADGELPSQGFLDGLHNHFSKDIRPLTDRVKTHAPSAVVYDAEVTYYIPSEVTDTAAVKSKIETAFQEFLKWQKLKIGRDVNPSELIFKLRDAGAKRVEVTLPTHIVVSDTEVAKERLVNLVFGGVEDD